MTSDLRSHLQETLGTGYVLGRELTGGGMSHVFVAEDTTLRRRVVVKVLPPEMAAELSIARFQREIALAARLQHPHIVPLLASGETQGLPYYTMPFVDGESLRERISRVGEFPIGEAVRLLREIATALAYAHERGIVHRDIKPENILLSGGIALITDFGVAKALMGSSTMGTGTLTTAGVAVGTPAYMSPEQVGADPTVDHRADLYSFGVLAYEMLTGQPPFAGRNVQALMSAHMIDVPESIERRRPAVPPVLAAIVMRCLEKRAADRPQQANEIVQALDSIATSTTSSTVGATPTNPRRALAFATLALVVVCAAGGGWAWLRHRVKPVSVSQARLLVGPFENLTGDAKFDHVGRVAADQLAQTVAQGGSIDVVPSNTVLMALRDTTGGETDRIHRLSEATHAGLLVSGTIIARGDSLAFQAQVTDVRTGKLLFVVDPATGVASDPTSALAALGDRLLGALATRDLVILSPQGFRAPKNAAYQEFAKGFERFALFGDVYGSRPFFERAIAIDSTYTRAYQLLARQYLNAGEMSRADSLFRRIETLPQGLTSAERLQADYMKAELNGDIAGELRAQQQLAARDSNPLSLHLIGEASNWLLKPVLSVPALERSRAAFLLMGGRAALGNTYLLTDAYHLAAAYDRELRTVMGARTQFSEPASFRGRQLRAYAGLGQPAAGLAVVDTMLRGDSSDMALQRVVWGAQEFRAHGDQATALRIHAMSRLWIASHQSPKPTLDRQLAEGITMLESGMPDSAVARFALVARDTTRLDGAGYLALSLLARGDRARARAVADSLGKLHRQWLFGDHTFWRAAIMGALGERDVAVQLLQQANREGQAMTTWHSTGALVSLHGYAPFDALVRPQR